MRMGTKRILVGLPAQAGTWFALLVACSGSLASAQVQDKASPQVQEATQEANPAPQSQSKEEPERIFGVVPAYSITNARNAPPLKSKEKFQLFVRGTLDPYPFVVYAIQAGVEQANNSHSGYGQGAAGYARRFGAALGLSLIHI